MSSPGADLHGLALLAENRRNTYSHVAALTFCIYDIILSSGQEVQYIWKSKVSKVTVLYLILRYFTAINLIVIISQRTAINLSVETCRRYYIWAFAPVIPIIILTSSLLLLLRIYALYNCRKRVLVPLLTLVFGNVAAALWAHMKMSKVLSSRVVFVPAPWRGCATLIPNLSFLLFAYVPDFALSLLFLSMTLWKLVTNYRDTQGNKLTWRSLRNIGTVSPPLLLAFVRDGSIFFALTSAATLFKIIFAAIMHEQGKPAFYPWLFVLDSYAGSHLVLNLRATGMSANRDQTWNETLSYQYHPERFRRERGMWSDEPSTGVL